MRRFFITILIVLLIGVSGWFGLKHLLNQERITLFVSEKLTQWLDRPIAIKGNISTKISMTPTIVVTNIQVAQTHPSDTPFATIERLELALALKPSLTQRILKVTSILIKDASIYYYKDTTSLNRNVANTNSKQHPASSTVKKQPAILLHKITAEKLTLHYYERAKARKPEHIMFLDQAELTMDKRIDTQLKGSINQVAVELDGTIGNIARLQSKQLALDIKGTVAGQSVAFSGPVDLRPEAPQFTLALNLKGEALESLISLLGSKVEPIGPFHIEGNINGSPSSLHADLTTLKVKDYHLRGKIHYKDGESRPHIDADLYTAFLDISSYDVVPFFQSLILQDAYAAVRIIPNSNLDFPFVKQIDGNIQLKIDALKTSKVDLSAVQVTAKLRDHVMRAQIAPINYQGGTLNGNVKYHYSNPPRLELRLVGKHMLMGKLLEQFTGSTRLEGGQGDITLHLTGSGKSLHPWIHSMSGNMSFAMGRATIKRLLELGNVEPFLQLLAEQRKRKDVEVYCGLGSFSINRGVAQVDQMVFDATGATTYGEGSVNLRNETLALTFYPTPHRENVMDLVFPLQVTGSFSNPHLALDQNKSAEVVIHRGIGMIAKKHDLPPELLAILGITQAQTPTITAPKGSAIGRCAGALQPKTNAVPHIPTSQPKSPEKQLEEELKKQLQPLEQQLKQIFSF